MKSCLKKEPKIVKNSVYFRDTVDYRDLRNEVPFDKTVELKDRDTFKLVGIPVVLNKPEHNYRKGRKKHNTGDITSSLILPPIITQSVIIPPLQLVPSIAYSQGYVPSKGSLKVMPTLAGPRGERTTPAYPSLPIPSQAVMLPINNPDDISNLLNPDLYDWQKPPVSQVYRPYPDWTLSSSAPYRF